MGVLIGPELGRSHRIRPAGIRPGLIFALRGLLEKFA
jgi:hypothetical protein